MFCFVWVLTYAQSFWIEPDKVYYTGKDSALISFFSGNGFSLNATEINQSSIKSILYCNGYEQKKLVFSDSIVAGFLMPLTSNATQKICVDVQFDDMMFSAEDFNKLLIDNGQLLDLQQRETNNQMNANAVVKNLVSAQTILQSRDRENEFCFQQASDKLQIVPLVNPYNSQQLRVYQSGGTFVMDVGFTILFNGEPLRKSKVNFWKRYANGKCEQTILYTNKKGIVTLPVVSPGTFMLTCGLLKKENNFDATSWVNYSSTLTFLEKGNFFIKK